jgi:tRNA(Arg) A34 adenosine deaminase TadA
MWAGRIGVGSIALLRGAHVLAEPTKFDRAETMMSAGDLEAVGKPGDAAFDRAVMQGLAKFTAGFLDTAPNPFGCEIRNTATGEQLMQAMNAVGAENDPSAHAEVRTMRLACAKLKSPSLKGYTLYTTCEPCPMCMSDALWAGVDRVVYGATIADANRFCKQIQIPAAEVAKRSDMVCVVDGPFEREICLAIFEDPRMVKAFGMWSSKK